VHQVPHISLAKKANAIVIAPATADVVAKIAHGIADDLLTNLILAAAVPIVVVPAMHTEMWLNPATQENIEVLRERGITIVEPGVGKLTSGDVGVGRYPETASIMESLLTCLDAKRDLLGKKVLISAGGTREPIDPVRYIGNLSSGKQGYAIALAAAARGAQVTLVAANTAQPDIEGILTIHVSTALEMQKALEAHFRESDVLIMSAAVADVRPAHASDSKIAKSELNSIELTTTPDITRELAGVKSGQVMIGFAAQTADTAAEGQALAASKLQEKGLDFIYFNDVSGGAIFGSDETEGVILHASGESSVFPKASKMTLADKLLDLALDKLG
jgi:phosphopantothenoylcysteine decarboxylase/phosphopantothenate--cysteine ligase